jgi:branched-chain amino acid transport system substrate-binding protein
MRWSRGRLIAVVGVLAFAGCTSSSSKQSAVAPEIRIGLLAPASATGTEAARGAQLAALVLNNRPGSASVPLAGAHLPGLRGAKVQIVQANSAGDPDTAVKEATRLVSERNVVGLISADTAVATAVASERTERIGVPFLGAVASADFLTERGLDWFFRVTPTDSMLAQASLAMLGQTSGTPVRRLSIVHPNDATSNEAATAIQGLAAQAGDEAASTGTFTSGTDAHPTVAQARGTNPDAVIAVAAQPNDAGALLAAGAMTPEARPVSLAVGDGFSLQTIRQAAQTKVLHSAGWSRDLADRNLSASAVTDLYRQRYKTPMTEAAAGTFTTTLTLAQAIAAAGSLDPQRVRTALLGLDVAGRDTIMPWGGIRLDQTGQNTLAAGLIEQVTRNSARVVFPRELAANTY